MRDGNCTDWIRRFDPRPPREGRHSEYGRNRHFGMVSIHAPTRGATRCRSPSPGLRERFDPRPHARGDTLRKPTVEMLQGFDPRPHARGDGIFRLAGPPKQRFRSTPPREGRREIAVTLDWVAKVSIHAPTRGATIAGPGRGGAGDVSIHAPTRGATGSVGVAVLLEHVSIHAPTRGATRCGWHSALLRKSFDPRPHARGDLSARAALMMWCRFDPRPHARGDNQRGFRIQAAEVSIHAPTRGATRVLVYDDANPTVSIHAPTRGATAQGGAGLPRGVFRSTPPREGRLAHLLLVNRTAIVSIHAPTRGATWLPQEPRHSDKVSIHAPTRGATLVKESRISFMPSFRSTPPREGRQAKRRWPSLVSRFDPRPHARGDRRPAHVSGDEVVSIHAPTRGATWEDHATGGDVMFRSTPPREGRPSKASFSARSRSFRSTPPREGRPGTWVFPFFLGAVSIHAPTRGATTCPRTGCGFGNRFDPRPPREGRPSA